MSSPDTSKDQLALLAKAVHNCSSQSPDDPSLPAPTDNHHFPRLVQTHMPVPMIIVSSYMTEIRIIWLYAFDAEIQYILYL